MNKDFDEKEYRDAFVEEFVRTGTAFQIRALREREGWSQKQLGEAAGKAQNVISRIEDPDYGKVTLSTLLSLASAFDVALAVRFVSFGDLWRSTKNLSQEALAVDRYADEKKHVAHRAGGTAAAVRTIRRQPAHAIRITGTNLQASSVTDVASTTDTSCTLTGTA